MSGIYPIKGIVTDLTPREKWYLIRHLNHVSIIREDANKALAAAQQFFPDSTWNGPGDAFRHCFWSSMLARDIGADNAKEFTDAHEAYGDNPPGEKAMDLHNNSVGIEIGRNNPGASDTALAGACINALNGGELQTSP